MSTGDAPPESSYDKALAEYQSGMTNLGRSLFAVAALLVLGGVVLVSAHPDPILVGIMSGMTVLQILLGVFAVKHEVWVNYVVMLLYTAILVLNLWSLGQTPEQGKQTSNPGSCIGLLICCAFIYYTRNNLMAYSKVKSEKARLDSAPPDMLDGPQ